MGRETLGISRAGMCVISTVAELHSECHRRRAQLKAQLFRIPLSGLHQWSITEEGFLAHRTGRFFRVVGARFEEPSTPGLVIERPMIDQAEIGILCLFVTVINGQYYGLITFKFEPGTPDGIEVAPSVQATRSNYQTVHGGMRVPGVEIALSKTVNTLVDALQREQEEWFLGKVNRNRIILLDENESKRVEMLIPDSYWVPISVLLASTLQHRLINMDLRSILSMWPLDTTLTPITSSSANTNIKNSKLKKANTKLVPLNSLEEWKIGEYIEHRAQQLFSIVGYRVEGQKRETQFWDQPLLVPARVGQCSLLLRKGKEGIEMLITERVRIGSVRGPTIEPMHQRGDIADYTTATHCVSMLEEAADLVYSNKIYTALQTEEGGRFHGAMMVYQLGLLGAYSRNERADCWMSLAEIDILNWHGDCLSIELRTCLAMLKGLILTGNITL
ncbi:NDP-hexose 2,3-dehydratase family protein [Photorhabdus tasmaniensis]|uniref:NDP-hexose 2,3-dehydratase family protein n=1 Tax=Photorhabdus tasmaniensis TaxID=1004159 RepID=UPI00404222B8